MVDERQLQFREILKSHGYSHTKARSLVFELLLGEEPQTMHELYERIGGRIDRASLYRTVDLFERIGIVERLQSGWKYKLELTDSFNRHHHHITCVSCGLIIPITEDEDIENLISILTEKHGFLSLRHQLEIQGYCNSCRLEGRHVPPAQQDQHQHHSTGDEAD